MAAGGGAGSLVRQPRRGGAKEGPRAPARRPLGIPRDADKGIPVSEKVRCRPRARRAPPRRFGDNSG